MEAAAVWEEVDSAAAGGLEAVAVVVWGVEGRAAAVDWGARAGGSAAAVQTRCRPSKIG